MNHTHCHKDITIIIIYIQVFIIYDKNGTDNPNGRQSENHFTLVSKYNSVFTVTARLWYCGIRQHCRRTAGTHWRPGNKEMKNGSLWKYLENAIIHLCNNFFYKCVLHLSLHLSFEEYYVELAHMFINCSSSRAGSTIQFPYTAFQTVSPLYWNNPFHCSLSNFLCSLKKNSILANRCVAQSISVTVSPVQQHL